MKLVADQERQFIYTFLAKAELCLLFHKSQETRCLSYQINHMAEVACVAILGRMSSSQKREAFAGNLFRETREMPDTY